MYLSETFKIGNEAGEYTEGYYIQDKIFENSNIQYILRNDQPTRTGYSISTGRMYFEQQTTNGDVIIVNFYKY